MNNPQILGMHELSEREQMNIDGGNGILVRIAISAAISGCVWSANKVVDAAKACYDYGYQLGRRSRR